jgi:hypothetical protein
MVVREVDDPALLLVSEPVVTWQPGIVLVDFAVAFLPVVELAGAQADPANEAADADLGLVAPDADEVNEVIPGVRGNPASL